MNNPMLELEIFLFKIKFCLHLKINFVSYNLKIFNLNLPQVYPFSMINTNTYSKFMIPKMDVTFDGLQLLK